MTIQIETNIGHRYAIPTIGFSGGERHVQLPTEKNTPIERAIVRAQVGSANDLLDLLLVENALRHAFGKDLVLDLEIPYLPYSRQDRVCAEGQAFSLEVMARLIAGMNFRKVITWDCHSDVGIRLTNAINVTAVEVIKSSSDLVGALRSDSSVLICPDKGAEARCQTIKDQVGVQTMIRCEKRRDPATGKITHTEVLADDLTGKTAIITDDICDGGYTFIKIAEQLKAKNAEKVILYVTHGIFSKGLDVFENLIDVIYTTKSFARTVNDKRLIELHYSYQGELK